MFMSGAASLAPLSRRARKMEPLLIALIAAMVGVFGPLIIVLVSRGNNRATEAAIRAEAAALKVVNHTATNGTKRPLGELVELIYEDLQTTKRDLAAHERRYDAHGIEPGRRRL